MDLRTYRTAHGLSLAALAERIGTTKSYLSQVELGQREVSMDMARRIAAATEGAVTPNDLANVVAAGLREAPDAA